MNLGELVQEKRQDILRAAAQRGARNVRLFGSVARGESTTGSDVDFLVELDPDRSLFDLAHLIVDLEDLLGCKVDVVTEDAIYWLLRRRILREARPL